MARRLATLIPLGGLLAALGCGTGGGGTELFAYGTVAVPATSNPDADRSSCTPAPPYREIGTGTPVTVTGPSGEVVAQGDLSAAIGRRGGEQPVCLFPFMISGIPSDLDGYELSVRNRGAETFSEAELRLSGPGPGIQLDLRAGVGSR